jgi:hypothetical protein
MAPSRRRFATAVVVGLVATLAAVGAGQPTGRAAPAPEPDPTVSASASTPPPPPAPRVAVSAQDVPVTDGYWQGAAETYPLSVSVRNPGVPPIDAITQVFLPVGVRRAGLTAPGCTADGLSIDCPIAPGSAVTIIVDVIVAPGLWRDPPLGTVRTKATGAGPGADTRTASAETTFGLDFPPGPPTPGIDLSVSDPFLPADPVDPTAGTETSTLEIRLANTGAVQADGAVDVVTAAGVGIATVPAQCVTRIRLSPDRERCELGRIPAGQRVTLEFGLVVTRAARAEAPLLGSVHGALTPAGQDTVTVVASYRVLITNRPVDATGPGTDGDPAVTVAKPPNGTGIDGTADRGRGGSDIGQASSVLPMLISLVGVFTVLAAMVIVSNRPNQLPN